VDPFYQRRRRYEAVLRPLGLADGFNAMQRDVREHFWRMKTPDPTLSFDERLGDGPNARSIKRGAEERFRAATVDVDGTPMAVRDFLGVVTACMNVVRGTRPAGFGPEVGRFLAEAGPVLERVFSTYLNPAFAAMYEAVNTVLVACGRLNHVVLSARIDLGTSAAGKVTTGIVVTLADAQFMDVTIRNIPRRVYRVGTGSPSGEPAWLSLTRAELGMSKKRRPMPVYVQGHALKRLHERVNLPTAKPYLESWLAESLSKPRVVERQGSRGQHLVVEYRIGKHRFGYLIMTVMRRMAVVRTFKFLTMSSTPEGKKLEKRLRITRADVDHLGLHELDAFTQTDLSADPELRWLLKRCGCGHLFELEPQDYAAQPKAVAADVKRYLKRAA
jgi:hypothetical protein